MAQYDRIQLIAYQVPTDLPLPPGNVCDIKTLKLCAGVVDMDLIASLTALSDDARSRVTRMLAVIDQAMQSRQWVQGEETLKVFMAPEFYFRPQQGDAARSYTEKDRHGVLSILRRVFAQKKLVGWLFVLGTIVWNLKGQNFLDDLALDASTELLENIAKQDIVINTVLIAVGGYGLTSYDKLHYSAADNIPAKYRAQVDKKRVPRDPELATIFDLNVNVQQRLTFSQYFEWMRKRNKAQSIQGIGARRWFGVEVCLDHDLRVLQEAYKDFAKTQPNGAPPLDFQLLTACGMRVQAKNVTVGNIDKRYQYILRNDGISCIPSEWEAPYDPSEIQVVRTANPQGVLETITAQNGATKNAWKDLNVIVERIVLSNNLKLDTTGLTATVPEHAYDRFGNIESVTMKEKPLDEWFPQRIAIYRPLPLLAPKPVKPAQPPQAQPQQA